MRLTDLRGTVTARNSNASAVVLEETGEWFNLSKFADPAVQLPDVGADVTLGLDSRGLIRACTVHSEPAVVTGPSNRAGGPSTPKVAPGATLDHRDPFLRATALRCAVRWLATDPAGSEGKDVLAVAETYLSWLALREPSRSPAITYRD